MVKHKKTIKRQRNLQKQRGKGKDSACASASKNNANQMSNLSTEGDRLYKNLRNNLALVNTILDGIQSRSKKDQDDELGKVFNLLKITRSVADLDVITQNTVRLRYIKDQMRLILERIKAFRDFRASRQSSV